MNTINSASAAGRDVDVRGFVYTLEPIRQKQQWRLDKLMADLARAQQLLTETEDRLAELQQRHDLQAEASGKLLLQRLDPEVHRRALGYLAQLRGQAHHLAAERDGQRSARDRLREACVAQQLRIESLTRHKDDALVAYADEVRKRGITEQDRDWLARSVARRRVEGAGR